MAHIEAHSTQKREFAFEDRDFRFLAKLANERTGIVLAENKRDMIYGRLVRRLRALQLDSFSDYCTLLQSDEGSEEIGNLVNAITTNLTSFFREAHHFKHLREEVINPFTTSQTGGRFRIWSAGCSSGMEPYSIAMTLKNAMNHQSRLDAKILATDIDSNMLNIGIKGHYAASDIDGIPAAYTAYTERVNEPNQIGMTKELKDLVSFRQLNLLESWPMKGAFDVIFCRNVVIYFDKPTKQKLFARMADIMQPQGWLYIGHSENLHGISDRFELVGRTIYRKVK